jgi:hypothetical protein
MKYYIKPLVLNVLTGEEAVKISIGGDEELGTVYRATVTLFTAENKAISSVGFVIEGEDYKDWKGDNQTLLSKVTAYHPLIKLTGDVEENPVGNIHNGLIN